jgi:hypothetical protein
VDDERALYPLTIDPLMTSPAWTAEPNQANAVFGISVATAGDVNGDGYSDVIVGAQYYDNGQSDEGRAFVYHGSASGLSVTPNWTAESDQANAFFGYSVATAGDVNGDGFSDVIVGAFYCDNGQANEGRAFVYHGSAGGLSVSPDWTAEGDQVLALFGFSVATAGDVNGDGYSDVVVGASTYDNGQTDEGRAFVYHGSAGGLSATPNWTGEGNQIGAQFGGSVATAGDVNGDGFADVIIGAWVYTSDQGNEGRAFVYHGSAGGLSLTPGWTAEGNQTNAYFGSSVSTAGDVNGDGYADVIVGAQSFTNGQSAEGRAFVYHGSAGGLAFSAAWTAEPDVADASFGHSLGTAGDVNGDGYADVIIGAMNLSNGQFTEGRAYVYLGSRLGVENLTYWTAESNQADAHLGSSVATAGDVNGDGYSDVIVGAPYYDNGQSDEGRAYVYHGSAGGLATQFHWQADGNQVGASLGYSVATAGDVNGDGYSDAIVGVPYYDNGQDSEGRAYVYHGTASGLSDTPAWIEESDQPEACFGGSVATAGDVNGDGFSDVIVGASNFSGGQDHEGRAYVYHGSAGGLSPTPAWIAEGDYPFASFAGSVATAGDVNGDGFSDVIIGAYSYSSSGRAFVYHGSANGLGVAEWAVMGGQSGAEFGASVATAGDVNGDGYADVIVGAPGSLRSVFVYSGSAAGLAAMPAWTEEGDGSADRFGASVATAGDVNGDGYSDVIVGAPFATSSYGTLGQALVYHGSPSGLGIANWIAEITQSANIGWSAGTAGDVNGDGFSDVIVGAPRYDNGQEDEGLVLVYHGSSIGLSSAAAWIRELNEPGAHLGFSVAAAGDVNGDGFADVIVGANDARTGQDGEGVALCYFGNERQGLDRLPGQAYTDDSAPIAPLGSSDSPSAFLLKALGRSAAGRGAVRLEAEVKPFGVPFDGSGIVTGDAFDTGAPSQGIGSAVPLAELAGGLVEETLYHWRLRIASRSPFFPRSPWFTPAGNALTEADLRTAAPPVGIADEGAPAAGLLVLDPVRPNPLRSHGEIAFTLAEAGQVRLAAYDVTGRQVAVLTDGLHAAGRHTVPWDGRDTRGNVVPDGVYFVRLEAAGWVTSRKVVIAR